ncbi:single-stranded DNA-binding protein [Nonomuraea sp. NPDC049649]|uniref:single-stranded DNA-binding protein n=1 Tax=Nonomuraea sp. NPDC049649 TaxID=3155776 RepID=UPI0034462659
MDRNEVLLVGRLSAAVEERSLPSGDTMTKWRLLVRRRTYRRGGTVTDSIPCVSFSQEVADVLRGLNPRDAMEVTGAFRCRVFGPASGKIWAYEVEAATVKAIDALPEAEPSEPPPPSAPRPAAALAKAGGPEASPSQGEEAGPRQGGSPGAWPSLRRTEPRSAAALAKAS